MRFRQFEVFHAVMTTGGVSDAAQRLGISQPSVTKTLQLLEAELGYRLFDRIKGRLHPTEEARLLMREAERAQAAMDDLREASLRLRHGSQDHLRIVATPALGHEVLPDAVTTFARQKADIRLTISTRHSGEVLEEIAKPSFGFDLGFVFDAGGRPASIGAMRIGTVPIATVSRPRTFARPGPEVGIDDLVGRTVIGLDDTEPLGKLVADLSRTSGLMINSPIRVQTYRLACALALRDNGVAIVDGMTAASVAQDHVDAEVRLFPPDLSLPVNAVYPLSTGLPLTSREFVEVFEKALASQLARLRRRLRGTARRESKD
ncbi:MAG: LysR family transcriptional regulator [Hyphomonadaceae bacterium]